MTAADAITHIRATAANKETINMCYVIDETRHLIGEVSLGDIILADSDTPITDLLAEDLISVHTTVDREDVAHAFVKYDIVTMPIVDTENRLVGIITVDDVLDIIEEETTRDMEMMAAVTPTEKSYKQLTVTSIWKSRIPWLLFLLISSTVTSFILMRYENALAKYVILSAFIPMIADTGGNAGSQSSSTIIRSLSLKEINYSDLLYVLWKEFKVSILSGFTLGLLTFLKLMYFDKLGFSVSITVALTIFFTVVIAKATGAILPIITKKIGMDPAVMSSPLITTVVDALAILLYLRIAIVFLDITL